MANVFTMICFGDSVTKGAPYVAAADCFVQLLGRRVNQRLADTDRRFRCINAGVGGENTFEGLARIDADVLQKRPDLVAVEFGLNDIRYEPEKTVTEEQFAANLREIIRRIRQARAEVILMTPTPIVNAFHPYSLGIDYYDPWGGCDGLNAIYAGIIRGVAKEEAVDLCDIYGRFIGIAQEAEFRGETPDWRDFKCLGRYISVTDGVHPTAAGHEVIGQELYKLVLNKLQGLGL
jgi:acyl-CoA thioesterase-1